MKFIVICFYLLLIYYSYLNLNLYYNFQSFSLTLMHFMQLDFSHICE